MNNRRNFLAATAASAALLSTTTARIFAADPPVRTEPSMMKLSLAAYSFNSLYARRGTLEQIAAAKMSLEKFITYCAQQGLGAAELTGYYFPKDVTPEYLASIKQLTHRLGIDISGTAIGNNFCLPDGEAREAQLAMCRDWIDYAAMMGAPVIRIFAGNKSKDDTEEVAIDRCVAGINQSLEYAATKGVFLALENHGGITATPKQMLKIIDKVDDSPWFGVNFDSGNFRTDDPYRDLATIAPYAVNAQIKVAVSPNNAGKQPADIPRVIKILKDAKYRGYVTLEFEEQKPFEEIPKYLDQLRELIG
ncbi:sugar phosphate isomerase/epimerase family protein [Mariniblastus fucicola]|uniref:Endonuclease 4 n=1 Tax=Mariniblastus fucicola TaxID=980251 RepID=A0A5B9P730_9BACT|nr:sugar phosphate isomerase/epimerase family protein [Mariniblastus fucicola]QEG20985.1 endonuclease 4 [Mariniblastus fucicola]